MTAPAPHVPTLALAAGSFRSFFGELRHVFLERETLLSQLELALLCREHLLVIGPPGTGKSALAASVLGRIVDARTGNPSLFARQLTESTVQTDLIGPVDFKVLTETGRTEYLTEDGMLGATHAFLDEVFDGRDMLLRAILNVLHERELKHGRKVTQGRTETAVMTSNRYLSEVVARSPELLVAFADRLAFVCFVPKAFSRPQSRAAMLERAVRNQRPELRASLSLQELALLQSAVERVQVPGVVLEGLELLAARLERSLAAHAQRVQEYVPTRLFSQRSLVKAVWVLKAAVVRDAVWERPDRPMEATLEDLQALRPFFGLGGPADGEELEGLLAASVDPRERAQLDIVRAEGQAFAEALEGIRQEVEGGVEREAGALQAPALQGEAEALQRAFQSQQAVELLQRLRQRLVPGPRHAVNRLPLLAAARTALLGLQQALARGPSEGWGGMAQALGAGLVLCQQVPELREGLASLAAAGARLLRHAHAGVALSAEAALLEEGIHLDGVVGLAGQLLGELRELSVVAARVDAVLPEAGGRLRADGRAVRHRVALALRRCAAAAFQRRPASGAGALAAGAQALRRMEEVLQALDAEQRGLCAELLEPLARSFARQMLGETPFGRIEEYARTVQTVVESLRREGLSPASALEDCLEVVVDRLVQHAQGLRRAEAVRALTGAGVGSGEAYHTYRKQLAQGTCEGELAALQLLEELLAGALSRPHVLPASLREQVAEAELASLQVRVGFLREWMELLLQSLGAPERLAGRAQAEAALDRLVKSRFPLLVVREGELLRVSAALEALTRETGVGEAAHGLEAQVQELSSAFASFSQRLLSARSAR